MRKFDIPESVKRRQKRLGNIPVSEQSYALEEAWWRDLWRARGLPDPLTVTLDEFRAACRDREKMSEAKHANLGK